MQSNNKFEIVVMAVVVLMLMGVAAALFSPAPEPGNIQDLENGESLIEDTVSLEDIQRDILNDLITAFVKVESNGNIFAYNAKENAAGDLQERPCMIAECNRIRRMENPECELITLEDRYDPELSHYVFEVVQLYHNPELDVDAACDVWNHGCSKEYRDAVKREFSIRKGGEYGAE